MRFGLILAGVTFATLVLIFGFYKIFLQKQVTNAPIQINQSAPTLKPSNSQSLSEASTNPSSTPKPSVSLKPKASPKRSTIGTIQVLQDNTYSQTSTTGNSAISGTISFTGSAPSGTSIVIVARKNSSGDNYKTVVSGISAANGTSWSWSNAQIGTAYDMIAILKGSSSGIDTDYASSQTYIVNAPALNQVFSLNAASAPSMPTDTITTTCNIHNSNNTWTGYVNFPTVSGAQWYKMQVGTTSEGTDTINTIQSVQSGSFQTVGVVLNDSVTYYAQYSIANVQYPTEYQYSDFSDPQTIRCP